MPSSKSALLKSALARTLSNHNWLNVFFEKPVAKESHMTRINSNMIIVALGTFVGPQAVNCVTQFVKVYEPVSLK